MCGLKINNNLPEEYNFCFRSETACYCLKITHVYDYFNNTNWHVR